MSYIFFSVCMHTLDSTWWSSRTDSSKFSVWILYLDLKTSFILKRKKKVVSRRNSSKKIIIKKNAAIFCTDVLHLLRHTYMYFNI